MQWQDLVDGSQRNPYSTVGQAAGDNPVPARHLYLASVVGNRIFFVQVSGGGREGSRRGESSCPFTQEGESSCPFKQEGWGESSCPFCYHSS